MNEGWIKIHRSILTHWIWEDPVKLKRWFTILMNVNHAPKKFPVGNKLLTCDPGQSFRSIQQWTDLFSCSKSTTIKFFEMLEDDGMIKTEILGNGNRRKHLLIVANWDKYQGMSTGNYTETVPEIIPEQYPNVPPNKKEKNGKNDKNSISVIFEEFRKKYPGTKRGHDPELKNFLKKNKPEIVSHLIPALEKEIQHRESLRRNNAFTPEWKNLTTWINQKCWTQEFPELNLIPTNGKSNGQGTKTEILMKTEIQA